MAGHTPSSPAVAKVVSARELTPGWQLYRRQQTDRRVAAAATRVRGRGHQPVTFVGGKPPYQYRHGWIPISPDAIRDSDAMRELLGDRSRHTDDNGDSVLGEIARQKGFDALPRLADSDEIDQLVAAGQPEMWRSVPDARFADQFKTGDYWAGRGIYGAGTYTFTPAGSGTIDDVHRRGAQYGGTPLRMTLKPDALTVEFSDLRSLQEEDIARLRKEKRNLGKAIDAAEDDGKDTTGMEADYENMSVWTSILQDPGYWAAANGYDAIIVDHSSPGHGVKELVVLNRGAVIVDRNV